jgi:hypothetical protein
MAATPTRSISIYLPIYAQETETAEGGTKENNKTKVNGVCIYSADELTRFRFACTPASKLADGAHLMEARRAANQDHGEPLLLGGMKPGPRSTPPVSVLLVSKRGRKKKREMAKTRGGRSRAAAPPSQTTFPSKTKRLPDLFFCLDLAS